METNNLVQLIKNKTRITSRCFSLIDHMYINSKLIKSQGTINLNISDHLPIYIIRKKTKEQKLVTTFRCRRLKYFDIETLKGRLLDIDWSDLYESTDPNLGWEILITHIRNVLDDLYPFQELKNVRGNLVNFGNFRVNEIKG